MSKKLKLEGLEIKSFVTNFNPNNKKVIRGGLSGAICPETYVCDPWTEVCTWWAYCQYTVNACPVTQAPSDCGCGGTTIPCA